MGKLNKNHSGFGTVEGILILIIVVLLGAVGWFVYDRNQNKTTPTSTISSTPTNTTTPATTKQVDPSADYLVIKEWDIKLKKGTLTQDAVYVIKDEHNLYLSTKTYISKAGGNYCKANGSTGVFTRGKAGYTYGETPIEDYSYADPYGDGVNKSKAVKVGSYYYLWGTSMGPCMTTSTSNDKTMGTYQRALSDLAKTVQAL